MSAAQTVSAAQIVSASEGDAIVADEVADENIVSLKKMQLLLCKIRCNIGDRRRGY